jgi:hypothetical protein
MKHVVMLIAISLLTTACSNVKRGRTVSVCGYLSNGPLELFPVYRSMWIGTSAR